MNLYQIIGVSNNAKPSMIEAAYRKATLDLDERYERGEDVIEARKNLLAAFEVLSNPAKREAYDDRLAAAQFGKKQVRPPSPPNNSKLEATPTTRARKFRLGTAIYAVSGFVLVYVFASAFNTRELVPPKYDRFNAQTECEHFVSQRLKAPATADFAPMRDLRITGEGNGPWTVEGYVDAQNSFGAKIRNRYTCSVAFNGDRVSLIGLSIN